MRKYIICHYESVEKEEWFTYFFYVHTVVAAVVVMLYYVLVEKYNGWHHINHGELK